MIRGLVLIVLALVVTLAAGLVTAIFIFRHPAPESGLGPFEVTGNGAGATREAAS